MNGTQAKIEPNKHKYDLVDSYSSQPFSYVNFMCKLLCYHSNVRCVAYSEPEYEYIFRN